MGRLCGRRGPRPPARFSLSPENEGLPSCRAARLCTAAPPLFPGSYAFSPNKKLLGLALAAWHGAPFHQWLHQALSKKTKWLGTWALFESWLPFHGGVQRRGHSQEIASRALGPHLEMQVGEHLGDELVPFHSQSGSQMFALWLSAALGIAPRPAHWDWACSFCCPSGVARWDAQAQSHLFVWLLIDTPLLPPHFCFWVKGAGVSLCFSGTFPECRHFAGASSHPCHPPPFTPALGTSLRTLWWLKWLKVAWRGSTVGGEDPLSVVCPKTQKNSVYLVIGTLGRPVSNWTQTGGTGDFPHCSFLLPWIYFNPKDPGELLLGASAIPFGIRDGTSYVFVTCLWKSGGFSRSSVSKKEQSRLHGVPFHPDSDARAGNASLLKGSDATVVLLAWGWIVCVRLDRSPLGCVDVPTTAQQTGISVEYWYENDCKLGPGNLFFWCFYWFHWINKARFISATYCLWL